MSDNMWIAKRGAKWPNAQGFYQIALESPSGVCDGPWGATEAEGDALIEQINRPAPLPVGVYRDGVGYCILATGYPVPTGWRMVEETRRIVPIPPAPPGHETEMVPWYQAKGRTHGAGWVIEGVAHDDKQGRPYCYSDSGHMVADADENGKVRVRVEK